MENVNGKYITSSRAEIDTLKEALEIAARSTKDQINEYENRIKTAENIDQIRQYQKKIKQLTQKLNRYNMYYMEYRLI